MTAKTGLEVLSFGCRLNAGEAEAMRQQGQRDGVQDTIVINTCAVTTEAVRQARQAIRKLHQDRPGTRLIVTGCAAQIDPASFAAMPEVDLVLGNTEKSAPGALLPAAERVRVSDIMQVKATAGHMVAAFADRASAYVEIQTGCDHRCTFCIIPYGRGNSRSVPAGEVVAAVARLAAEGRNEVVLTGVDLTSWGGDLPGRPTLGQLVLRILKAVPDLPRLRLSSIDAAEIDPDLMDGLARQPRLMPYLHLSLQSGDNLILKRMKRRHRREDALSLVAQVRAIRPDIAFGADLIAGFPTESQDAFNNTLRLVEDAGIAFLHSFPYSQRPGTPAARMPQLPRAVIKSRAAQLRAAGAAALCRHLDRQIGRQVRVIAGRGRMGWAEDFTEVVLPAPAPIGSLQSLMLSGHDGQRAIGQ